MKLSDIIICSDFDGTITGVIPDGVSYIETPFGRICRQNADAIKYFTEKGGRFVLVSGRSAKTMQFIYDFIPADDLMAGSNAAMIYSHSGKRVVKIHPMKITPAQLALRLSPISDELPVMHLVDADANIHEINASDGNLNELLSCFPVALKVTFEQHDAQKMSYLKDQLQKRLGDLCDIALSAPFLVECIDKNGGKDDMIRFLKEHNPNKTIVAIGDYENDVKMLVSADYAFCPYNASDKVKAVCNGIFRDSGNGFISDVVNYLEKL